MEFRLVWIWVMVRTTTNSGGCSYEFRTAGDCLWMNFEIVVLNELWKVVGVFLRLDVLEVRCS